MALTPVLSPGESELKLSVVIPCHNRREALNRTLESLCHQTTPADQFEVIVVDQASGDGSRQGARAHEASLALSLVEQDAKYGISVARNAGAETAAAPLVLLLDADLVAEPGLIAAHIACHLRHPGALACGRVRPHQTAYHTFVERAADPDAALDRGAVEQPLEFYQAFGGHLSFAVETFRLVGPFDPALRGFEDIDFAYRAQRIGTPIVSCPEAVAYHNHPRTLDQRMAQARAYNRMWAGVLRRYPELHGAVPGLRDYEPIDWRAERGDRLWAKVRLRLYAAAVARAAMYGTLRLLDRAQALPRVAKALYWRLLAANWYLGFREGSQR